MTGAATCSTCGDSVEPGSKFCERCGTPVAQAPVPAGAGGAAPPPPPPPPAGSPPPPPPAPISQVDLRVPSIPLRSGPATVGSSDECDVVVDDRSVSSQHLRLEPAEDGIHFRDLGSTGGTRVNGQPVTSGVLADGDVVGIGHLSWRLRGLILVPDRGENPPLEAHAISVEVGDAILLEPTSLTLTDGELVAVIGPSGSGKSTLLKALGGVRPSSSGTVAVRGDDVGVRQADIGYVPQDDTLHYLLTIREALDFSAQLRLPEDHSEAQRAEAIDSVLEKVSLQEIPDRRIGALSGGQRKRAAVALELISDPELLLLDEPTTGLDPGLERRLMDLLRTLADGGQTVLLVTHATQSITLCDRVAVMAPGGKLAYLGSPEGAPAAFGVDRFDEIYAALTSDLEADERATPAAPTPLAPPRLATSREVPRRAIAPQIPILVRRYSLLLARDRRNARILALQVVVLALGSALLFDSDVFEFAGRSTETAGESAQLLFLIVTVSIWFGAISSVRQVVAERTVLTRELAAGVRTESYLAAKGLVIGSLAAMQTSALLFIVFILRPLDNAPGGAYPTILILCVLASWVGVGIGLTLSAFARTEDQATSFLPLILLPQLLFGGAIVPIEGLGQPIKLLSNFAAAQWAFSGVGSAVDMNARIAGDEIFSTASRYGESFFDRSTFAVALVLVLMIATCAAILQARLRPTFENTWWQQAMEWWDRKLQENAAANPR